MSVVQVAPSVVLVTCGLWLCPLWAQGRSAHLCRLGQAALLCPRTAPRTSSPGPCRAEASTLRPILPSLWGHVANCARVESRGCFLLMFGRLSPNECTCVLKACFPRGEQVDVSPGRPRSGRPDIPSWVRGCGRQLASKGTLPSSSVSESLPKAVLPGLHGGRRGWGGGGMARGAHCSPFPGCLGQTCLPLAGPLPSWSAGLPFQS